MGCKLRIMGFLSGLSLGLLSPCVHWLEPILISWQTHCFVSYPSFPSSNSLTKLLFAVSCLLLNAICLMVQMTVGNKKNQKKSLCFTEGSNDGLNRYWSFISHFCVNYLCLCLCKQLFCSVLTVWKIAGNICKCLNSGAFLEPFIHLSIHWW